MTMVVHQQSPQILDSRGKTAIARLHSNLLNTSSTTVARQQYWCVSNLLQFGGATSLTMAMMAHRKSS
jgi:hypothetical protein